MRTFLTTLLLSLALFGAVATYSQLVANSRYLALSTVTIRDWARSMPPPDPEASRRLVDEARRRAAIYDRQIVQQHLVDGMVVNRTVGGKMIDQCDSLLFSSLRFVSLRKLGNAEAARTAWAAIQDSRQDGHWLRHPRCPNSTSRDMLVGLLIALSQHPENADEHLTSLIKHIEKNDGYFGTGPIYVSYLTPGLARFLGMMASHSSSATDRLPDIIRDGYSTAELEVMVTEQGYEAHLGSLSAWLELELAPVKDGGRGDPSALASAMNSAISPFSAADLREQRLDWITDRLVATDRRNLFFRYLRLRAADALTPAVRYSLLAELMRMPQFPPDHLPRNCDRRADFLWQRALETRTNRDATCAVEFSGTDYLWMAANLIEGWEPGVSAVAH